MPVLGYHVVLSNYGFWLPNDPRGSGSSHIWADHLKPFGPATKVNHSRSVARKPHDYHLRLAAKRALKYPPVVFDGYQALSVAGGFAEVTAAAGYSIYACSILPQHTHLVVGRHHYDIEQIGRLLKQAATKRLLANGRHPFADRRASNGDLPSVWARDFWPVYLDTPEKMFGRIDYVEKNPLKERNPRQSWSFVIPYRPV